MQVFDCQDMPDDIRRFFFNYQEGIGNDCYVKWQVYDYEDGKSKKDLKGDEEIIYIRKDTDNEDEWSYYIKGENPVSDWLFVNGSEIGDVIVQHWW